jgi:hypothetical protein
LSVAVTIAIAVSVAVLVTVAVPIPVAVAVSIPSYYGWLLCVGWRVLDFMDLFIASLIVIIVIIISLPSPAENHRVEMCEGGRGHGRWHSTIAMLRKGRQSKQEDVFIVIIVDDHSKRGWLYYGMEMDLYKS